MEFGGGGGFKIGGIDVTLVVLLLLMMMMMMMMPLLMHSVIDQFLSDTTLIHLPTGQSLNFSLSLLTTAITICVTFVLMIRLNIHAEQSAILFFYGCNHWP